MSATAGSLTGCIVSIASIINIVATVDFGFTEACLFPAVSAVAPEFRDAIHTYAAVQTPVRIAVVDVDSTVISIESERARAGILRQSVVTFTLVLTGQRRTLIDLVSAVNSSPATGTIACVGITCLQADPCMQAWCGSALICILSAVFARVPVCAATAVFTDTIRTLGRIQARMAATLVHIRVTVVTGPAS